MSGYSKRYCLFLDILGFADHVEQSKGSIAKVNAIAAVLDKVRSAGETEVVKLNAMATQFSDSLVISFDGAEVAGVEGEARQALLVRVLSLSGKLVAEGFLVRGGLALGDLLHDGSKVFGPAMVTAYRLEQAACFPRIKVSDEAFEQLASGGVQGEIQDYLTAVLESDGNDRFLNYLSMSRVPFRLRGPNGPRIYQQLNALGALIDRALAHRSESVRRKGIWAAQIYDIEVQKYASEEWGPQPHAVEDRFFSNLNRKEYGSSLKGD